MHHDGMQIDNDMRRSGALVAVGGNEDRTQDKQVLKAALGAATASRPPTVGVLTTASRAPGPLWKT